MLQHPNPTRQRPKTPTHEPRLPTSPAKPGPAHGTGLGHRPKSRSSRLSPDCEHPQCRRQPPLVAADHQQSRQRQSRHDNRTHQPQRGQRHLRHRLSRRTPPPVPGRPTNTPATAPPSLHTGTATLPSSPTKTTTPSTTSPTVATSSPATSSPATTTTANPSFHYSHHTSHPELNSVLAVSTPHGSNPPSDL